MRSKCTEKYMHFLIMIVGVMMSIVSLFLFSYGWERWQTARQRGSIEGIIKIANKPGKFPAPIDIALVEADGNISRRLHLNDQGVFLFSNVDPGDYKIEISGEYMPTKSIAAILLPSRAVNVGDISLAYTEAKLWHTAIQHSQLTTYIERNGIDAYVGGFTYRKGAGNTYYLSHRDKTGPWKDLIVPLPVVIERIQYMNSIGDDLVIGGFGAVFIRRNDNWQQINIPPPFNSICDMAFANSGDWLAVLCTFNKYGLQPTTQLAVSHDKGQVWDLLSQANYANVVMRHSSGRIIIGTGMLPDGGGILYSNDGGHTLDNSQIKTNDPPLGIRSILELPDGTLFAGSADAKKFKPDVARSFIRGGRIFRSDDGGMTWTVTAGDETWGDVNNLIIDGQTGAILASQGNRLLISMDRGQSWIDSQQQFGYWVNQLTIVSRKLVVVSNDSVQEVDIDRYLAMFSP